MNSLILCIFCGKKADIVKRNKSFVVLCRHCNRETDRVAYQEMFNQWLDETLKGGKMKLPHISNQ
jgi:ribosomal protein L37AE/L43A